jgi:hypothetical protein
MIEREGRGKREEGRGKREEGRGKREEGRENEVGLGGYAENDNRITAYVRCWNAVGFWKLGDYASR